MPVCVGIKTYPVEVVGDVITLELEKVRQVDEVAHVITSYSIHYTKLYESFVFLDLFISQFSIFLFLVQFRNNFV